MQNTPNILYSRYEPIKLLIAQKCRLLFTYNADFIRYLTSLGSLRTFTESVLFEQLEPLGDFFGNRPRELYAEKIVRP